MLYFFRTFLTWFRKINNIKNHDDRWNPIADGSKKSKLLSQMSYWLVESTSSCYWLFIIITDLSCKTEIISYNRNTRQQIDKECLFFISAFFLRFEWKFGELKMADSLNCVFVPQMFHLPFVHHIKETFSRIERCQFSFLFSNASILPKWFRVRSTVPIQKTLNDLKR